MKINRMELITLVIAAVLASVCLAEDEKEKSKVNNDAIPPIISPDDPDMSLSANDHIRILNAKKADHITSGMQIGGKPMVSNSEQRTRERIHCQKIDANPRQTIPLKECIKSNGVIDNDVNECMNGRKKKTW
ncbi:hypothetical protein [Cellvibrio sp. UBA7661]|uniref:hypothetical protein n=1 Tax=Cellvibrio sp. UBA7661 TaxID=1946311 RepID=UPI002F35DBA1